jgi:hypothetical protein
MKFIITTTYEQCDQEFIDWYLERLKNEEVMPGSMTIVDELKSANFASFTSKDPSGPTIATTTYEILK